ncbi:MAG: dTDP-4-dehydrorhamnose 3,5-epimerase [Thermodesulfobacteriota bacterium]|nr:dTDP-4-dehydrorhamnose 3,5-epimerase [Thermodesulfobacteriota bacterium]
MQVSKTSIADVKIIAPALFEDQRGFFMETYNRRRYIENGIDETFVQDNLSCSHLGIIRGLHYQFPNPQAKLVYVISGEVFDVAVDIRQNSPTFGKWTGTVLSGKNRKQMFIPAGFAHGFQAMSDHVLLAYKCSDFYDPAADRVIRWDDPDINISWNADVPGLSEKDANAPYLREVPANCLPETG